MSCASDGSRMAETRQRRGSVHESPVRRGATDKVSLSFAWLILNISGHFAIVAVAAYEQIPLSLTKPFSSTDSLRLIHETHAIY